MSGYYEDRRPRDSRDYRGRSRTPPRQRRRDDSRDRDVPLHHRRDPYYAEPSRPPAAPSSLGPYRRHHDDRRHEDRRPAPQDDRRLHAPHDDRRPHAPPVQPLQASTHVPDRGSKGRPPTPPPSAPTSGPSPTFHDNTSGGAQLPTDWVPDDNHLDSRPDQYLKLPFYRFVQSTPWSRQKGISGKPILSVNLADVSFRGFEENALRGLSAGKFTSPVFVHNPSEAVFVTRFLHYLRKDHIDLDRAGRYFLHHKNMPVPDSKSEGKALLDPLANHMAEVVKQFHPVEVALQANSQLVQVQAQLARLQEKAAQKGIQLTPNKDASSSTSASSLPSPEFPPAPPPAPLPLSNPPPTAPSLPSPHDVFTNSGRKRPLGSSSPKSHTNAEVTKWAKAMRDTLPQPLKTKVDGFTESIKKAYEGFSKATRPNLQDVAASYGLPVDLCVKMKEDALVKVIAIAALTTA